VSAASRFHSEGDRDPRKDSLLQTALTQEIFGDDLRRPCRLGDLRQFWRNPEGSVFRQNLRKYRERSGAFAGAKRVQRARAGKPHDWHITFQRERYALVVK
jgi:hypothetical protein